MVQKFFLVCILFSICLNSNGQDKSKSDNQVLDIALSLNIYGTKFLNNNEFINSLKRASLPVAFNKESIGLCSNIYLSKIRPGTKLIPIFGFSFLKEKNKDQNISLNALILSNDYNIGYLIGNHHRQYFYPGIGFGWMQYKFSYVNHGDLPATYPAALQNFGSERSINATNLTYLNITLNYDYSIEKFDSFLIGLRAAYHLGLNRKGFQLNDETSLPQSPRVNANSLSLGLALTVQ